MDDKEILEDNKLIAEFDDNITIGKDKTFKYVRNKEQWALQGLKYNSSWDWLMPVVKKIKTMEQDYPIATDDVLTYFVSCNIEDLWLAVVEFIKWYNTQNHEL